MAQENKLQDAPASQTGESADMSFPPLVDQDKPAQGAPPPLPGAPFPDLLRSGRAGVVPPPLPAGSPAQPAFEGVPPAAGEPAAAPRAEPPRAPAAEPDGSGRRVARRRPAGPVRGRVAANDDVPSIGGLIYALEQKPSSKPFTYAAVASGVWALIGGAFGVSMLMGEMSSGAALGVILSRPSTFALIAAVVVPIALLWLLALLAWRTEELRLRSSTMTEVAIRLAEPDRMAEQSIASLGQAVRRQVSFMNDAVSRALGRAGELEALVHSEVAALERSYEENERRIRGLIQELSGERHALLNTSDKVSDSLKSLGSEVPALIEKLATQQVKLASIIQGAGDNLTSLESAISQTSLQLEGSVERSSLMLESSVARSSERLEGVLSSGGSRIEHALGHGGERIEHALGQGGERIETALGHGGSHIEALLGHGGERIELALGQGGDRIGEALAGGAAHMEGVLEGYTAALGAALGSRNEHLQQMLEQHTAGLADTLEAHSTGLSQTLDSRTAELSDALGRRTDNLQMVFEEYTRALDSSISHRADALDTRLVERTKALDAAFGERLRHFDEAILRSTLAIDSAVGEKQKALTSALETHARTFGDTVHRQAQQLDESLLHGINAVRRSSENITRQSLKAIEGLASQSDMLKSVSENLLGQINTVTNRFENQGQQIMRAANALETVNYKIDHTLQTRQSALTETLDRLSGKADEFGRFVEGYSSSIEGSLTEAELRARAAADELKAGSEARQRAALADLNRLKSETNAEGDRALDELRRRLSSVSNEVNQQLGSLSSRFDETSEEVRQRAARAAAEFAEEQARLRREMERLPAATRESADAMRRALGDQIKALDQLSSYTSRAAVERDVSAPLGVAPAGSFAAPIGPTPPAAGEDAGRKMLSLTSTLAQELTARQPVRAPEPAVMAHMAQAYAPSASSEPAREGWSLGDLLKRASFDDDPGPGAQQHAVAPPQPAAEAPFSLNIDVVARALDPATASAIWARLRAGQRGIMVRSIYTAEGRATFDEVSRRYKTDAELRGTIDRYLADFDRIVKDAEARDPSGRLATGHLVSETGRVYLFLNHASGRLS